MGKAIGDDRDYEGGSERVKEEPEDVPKAGRTAGQTLIIAISVLVVLAGLVWLLVPLSGG